MVSVLFYRCAAALAAALAVAKARQNKFVLYDVTTLRYIFTTSTQSGFYQALEHHYKVRVTRHFDELGIFYVW